jgi:hypothetical protein
MHRRFLFLCFLVLSFLGSFVGFSDAGLLIYSTFLGGSNADYGNEIAVDSAGQAYIIGYTYSPDFPTTAGTIDTVYNGNYDVFLCKLNNTGTALIYSTFMGGSNADYSYGIALDSSGNIYIIGNTSSSDFPTTNGAFDTTFSYGDIFVCKISNTGSVLIYSTYIGGSSGEYGYDIALDNSGNAYITGQTYSSSFPTTVGAIDTAFNGYTDAFITKLNTLGSDLVYSTFLGGSYTEIGRGIEVDNNGYAYITGETNSPNFPITNGSFDTTNLGYDGFICKVNPSGSAFIYSTFLGGSNNDYCQDISIDTAGNAYLIGRTECSDFPTTLEAFDTTYNGGTYDAFVTKLNKDGTSLIYSTFLGGSANDYGRVIVVDTSGNGYVTGYSTSDDFPTTDGAFDNYYKGNYDIFISKLNSTGTTLNYSTYIGGSNSDQGFGIAIDSSRYIYLTGYTNSSSYFPVTVNTFDTTYNGNGDAFVIKISLIPVTTNNYLNSYGAFTVASDTTHWYFEKYGDGITAGSLSWVSNYNGQSGVVKLIQKLGEKGKMSQVFSVPSTGWYTAIAKVATDINDISKHQKVYLYLQELANDMSIVATGNQVIQPGAGGITGAGIWRNLKISFYAKGTVLGVQVVGINGSLGGIDGSLYIDDIWVYPEAPKTTQTVAVTNSSFDDGLLGWTIQAYGDATSAGSWIGWSNLLLGTQSGGEKGKISQMFNFPNANDEASGSVWVLSGASTMNYVQKIYLYLYSYASAYSKIIESGNAILQPGKWTPGQWRQLQFGYTPLTNYNAVQLVGINPISNPYQAIYFDDVEVKQ